MSNKNEAEKVVRRIEREVLWYNIKLAFSPWRFLRGARWMTFDRRIAQYNIVSDAMWRGFFLVTLEEDLRTGSSATATMRY